MELCTFTVYSENCGTPAKIDAFQCHRESKNSEIHIHVSVNLLFIVILCMCGSASRNFVNHFLNKAVSGIYVVAKIVY